MGKKEEKIPGGGFPGIEELLKERGYREAREKSTEEINVFLETGQFCNIEDKLIAGR